MVQREFKQGMQEQCEQCQQQTPGFGASTFGHALPEPSRKHCAQQKPKRQPVVEQQVKNQIVAVTCPPPDGRVINSDRELRIGNLVPAVANQG